MQFAYHPFEVAQITHAAASSKSPTLQRNVTSVTAKLCKSGRHGPVLAQYGPVLAQFLCLTGQKERPLGTGSGPVCVASVYVELTPTYTRERAAMNATKELFKW